MEQAILAGDIAWHALPFSWQTEMLDRSMIEGCLGLSADLDERFGRKTIAGKMTDVPGHSLGIVAPLAAHGIRLLDVGVNPASTPPEVPDVFFVEEPGWQRPRSALSQARLRQYGARAALRPCDVDTSEV